MIHQARYCPPVTPGEYGLSWTPIRLTASDGIPIAGWSIPHPAPKGLLLLLHGFGTSKADLLDLVQSLHRQGSYHLILIDFRGHGASGGKIFSFGKREILDIEAVITFLSQEPALSKLPLGCYGVSMGGAIALLAAARLPKIRAVVSDSAYADLARAVARTQWMAYHIPRIPLGQMVIWATQLRLGCRMRDLSPALAVGKIAPRPLFLIHGTKDRGIPPEEAQILFRSAGEPKQLWLVEGAEHVGCFYLQRESYLRRMVDFLDDAFLRAP
ncbi:MAG: alpha/beta fold hydrolase [Candidatus Omnitrophica bacterium]|nr:alpha/beta fold hydrolase [Candidatus Omnitrophota bacterium]